MQYGVRFDLGDIFRRSLRRSCFNAARQRENKMMHSLTSGGSHRELRSWDVPQQQSDCEEGADVNQKRDDPVAVYLGRNSIESIGSHRSPRTSEIRSATILRSLGLV